MTIARFVAIAGLTTVLLAAPPAAASTSVYMTPETLAERATLVVEARVVRVASGLRENASRVATYVDLDVDRVHRGPRGLTRLTLREPGGDAGDRVLVVDAAPRYRVGERVFAFLEPARDGALRTVGLFYGKYALDGDADDDGDVARRDLSGRGTILRTAPDGGIRASLDAAESPEAISKRALVALTAALDPTRSRRSGRAEAAGPAARRFSVRPPEFARLTWTVERRASVAPARDDLEADGPDVVALDPDRRPRFVALSPSSPTRWTQSDQGLPVVVDIAPGGNPLADDARAVEEMLRALDAWNDVPESRLRLVPGDTDSDFVATHPAGPADHYDGTNVILFDDPYDDISDPSGCSGVLAIGGYWRSGATAGETNGVTFHPALQLYVVFNNDFECFLGDPDNLAEVATHEIGHGIGLGHSTVFDAVMRSTAYGGRGPRLGDDDRDAAHCHYPHSFSLSVPAGNPTVVAGETLALSWNRSVESSGDDGSVRLQYSTDDGSTWKSVVESTANDGWYEWTVPDDPATNVRVRLVRPARMGANPGLYDEFCSLDAPAPTFAIASAPAAAPGSIATGSLRVEPAGAGDLWLGWSAGCSPSVTGYSVYEGSLTQLRAGYWEVAPLVCDAGVDLERVVTPTAGDRFYLVVPYGADEESALGDGRPSPAATCRTPVAGATCG